jgi:hypothetical protein
MANASVKSGIIAQDRMLGIRTLPTGSKRTDSVRELSNLAAETV